MKSCLHIKLLLAGIGIILTCFFNSVRAQTARTSFRIVILAERGGIHAPFVESAKIWLNNLAKDSSFTIDYLEDTQSITDSFLSNYSVFIQLNYPPYGWSASAVNAFEKHIQQDRKFGWIGFHHATLLGEFDGYPIWPWFSEFMGGIRYKDYIPTFASGIVNIEDTLHPCMKGIPSRFIIEKEEWYTYDKSPRSNVHVLASVDERSYIPDTVIKMGDHPVIWINEHMAARNIYIFMGHHPGLFQNKSYCTLFRNAIFWAAGK